MGNIISSFFVKNTLCPDIWENHRRVDKSKMKLEIKDGLLEIVPMNDKRNTRSEPGFEPHRYKD